MATTKTITEQLEKKITPEMNHKHFEIFSKQAKYLGNGVYGIPGTNLISTCTRELFLMFAAVREGIKFKIE